MVARYKKSEEIQTALLDVAESLFAERGFFGVSVRDITEMAGVRNASINYHFESKEKLFMAVIDRRIEPLSAARIEKLARVSILSSEPDQSVKGIVTAFAEPMLNFAENGGPGWKNYCILVAHLGVQKFWGENAVSDKYDVQARKFLEALHKTFPNADPYLIHCSFQFLLSTTLYAVCDNKRINTLSSNNFRSDDISRLRGPFLEFMMGGISSILQN